jgi:hypothetical protein
VKNEGSIGDALRVEIRFSVWLSMINVYSSSNKLMTLTIETSFRFPSCLTRFCISVELYLSPTVHCPVDDRVKLSSFFYPYNYLNSV